MHVAEKVSTRVVLGDPVTAVIRRNYRHAFARSPTPI